MKGVVATTETSASLITELHAAVANASIVIQELTSLSRRLETRINELEESEARWQEAENRAMSEKGFGDLVCLNVGGQRFVTTESTLRRSRYLSNMLDRGRQTVYIVDQNPTFFGIILNYLRNGTIPKSDIKGVDQDRLAYEFQLYGIPPPNFTVSNNRTEPGLLPSNPFFQVSLDQKVLGAFEGGSVLAAKQKQTLVEWLPDKKFALLYKATRDGPTAEDFHRACDNKGPNLVVVQTGASVFGGYTMQSWDSNLGPKGDSSTFIFTLVNPHGIPPTRYYPKTSEARNAITCNSLYGPVFGGSACDIQIFALSFDSTNASCNFPGSYADTTGKGKETFAGTARFSVGEVEVFSVS